MLTKNLVIISALPKSSSSHFRDCLKIIHKDKIIMPNHRVIIPKNLLNENAILKYHFPPIDENVEIAKDNKHIITLTVFCLTNEFKPTDITLVIDDKIIIGILKYFNNPL